MARQQALSDGVLDQRGDLSTIRLTPGREDLWPRLEQLFPDAAAPEYALSAAIPRVGETECAPRADHRGG